MARGCFAAIICGAHVYSRRIRSGPDGRLPDCFFLVVTREGWTPQPRTARKPCDADGNVFVVARCRLVIAKFLGGRIVAPAFDGIVAAFGPPGSTGKAQIGSWPSLRVFRTGWGRADQVARKLFRRSIGRLPETLEICSGIGRWPLIPGGLSSFIASDDGQVSLVENGLGIAVLAGVKDVFV